jgi:hypothetical protein
MNADKSGHNLLVASTVITLVASAWFLGAAPALATTPTVTIHTGSSYGARVAVGSTVKLGPVAPAILPACDTQAITTVTASAASISDNLLIDTGVVDSVATSTANSTTTSSDVLGVRLLNGVITANEIKAVSTTGVNSSGTPSFSAAGSIFSNLSILGLPVSANPAPNTTIVLPGIGSVVLNEQSTSTFPDFSVLTVNMIHVHVTLSNLLGYPVGTDIVVGQAMSEVQAISGVAAVGGYAYAPKLTAGSITSGPIVSIPIPCGGTHGAVDSDTIASTSIPGVVSTGTVTVTGMGNINHTGTTSEATTTTASLNLLSNLVSATAIQAVAAGATTDGMTFDFTGGTTFGSISVAGHPEVTASVAPNTKITLPGLGTLYLNLIDRSFPDKIRVVPLELDVTSKNTLGLAVGAQLLIGAAEAQLHSSTIP